MFLEGPFGRRSLDGLPRGCRPRGSIALCPQRCKGVRRRQRCDHPCRRRLLHRLQHGRFIRIGPEGIDGQSLSIATGIEFTLKADGEAAWDVLMSDEACVVIAKTVQRWS